MTQTEEIQKIETQFMKELKKNSGTAIGMGIFLLLLGFLAMGAPLIAGVSIAKKNVTIDVQINNGQSNQKHFINLTFLRLNAL